MSEARSTKKAPLRISERSSAHAHRKSELTMVNGRLVGPTLNDPEVKKRLDAIKGKLLKDPQALRASYVKRGVLTQGGKLTKAYGG